MKTIKIFTYLFVIYIILSNDVSAQIKDRFIETEIRSGGSVIIHSTLRLTNRGLFYKITRGKGVANPDSSRYFFIPIDSLDSSLISGYIKLLYTYENLVSENKFTINLKEEYRPANICRIVFYDLENNKITMRLNLYIAEDPIFKFYYLLFNMIKNKTHKDLIEHSFFSEQRLNLFKTIYKN